MQEVDSKFERLQTILREEGDKKKKIEQKLTYFNNLEGEVRKLMEKVDTMRKSYLRKLMKKKKQQNLIIYFHFKHWKPSKVLFKKV